jgi:deoxyribonuclease V
MTIHPQHAWDVSETDAIALQRQLASRVVTDTPLPSFEFVAGADISYNKHSSQVYAGVVVIRVADFTVVERQGIAAEAPFPYIPGLLSFREAPVVLQAFAKVASRVDVVMCDGQGTAHPRRFGLACHLGLWLDVPCLGCAKSRLTGSHAELAPEAGAHTPLLSRGRTIGAVVRTRTRTNPVYVSPGHKIDLASAIGVTLATCHGYRIPEPTRQAHLFVNELRLAAAE